MASHDAAGSDKGLVIRGGIVDETKTALPRFFRGICQRSTGNCFSTVTFQSFFGLKPTEDTKENK